MSQITVAVVTGRHPYNVRAFHALFRSMEGVDAYIQHMEDWSKSSRDARAAYDVVLFYNMHTAFPPGDAPRHESGIRPAIEELGTTEQGIVVLHHGIVAFRDSDLWADLVGVRKRGGAYSHGETVRLEIADPDHPITEDLASWEMVDETYIMDEPGPGSQVLITTDNPNSTRAIAWTRQFGQSRVFCFQSGHDDIAYSNPSFREVLRRGILWTAHRLKKDQRLT